MSLLADWRHRATRKQLARLAIPMTLSNISVPLTSLAGSSIAGHLAAPQALAAVAMGSAIYMLPVWGLGFLRMTTSGLVAQSHGRQQSAAGFIILQRGLIMALGLGLSLLVGAEALAPALLKLMHLQPALSTLSLDFIRWRYWGLPAALIQLVLNGWLLGQSQSRRCLQLLWIAQASHLMLSLALALGLAHGVAGIAQAAVISEYLAAAIGLRWAWQQRPRAWPWPNWRWSEWRPLLQLNRDIFIRSLALQAVFASLTWFGSQLGSSVVAANALLLNGLELTAFVLDGIANAVEILAGQAIGAADRQALRRCLVVSSGWTGLGALGFSLGFAIAGPRLIALMTPVAAIRVQAIAVWPWLIALPLIAAWSYLLDGLFIGATRASTLRNTMLGASATYFALLALAQPLSNQGLWLALSGFMAMRGLLLARAGWQIQRRQGWIAPVTRANT